MDLKHDRNTNRMRGNVFSPTRIVIESNITWLVRLVGYIICIFLLISYTGVIRCYKNIVLIKQQPQSVVATCCVV